MPTYRSGEQLSKTGCQFSPLCPPSTEFGIVRAFCAVVAAVVALPAYQIHEALTAALVVLDNDRDNQPAICLAVERCRAEHFGEMAD